MDLPLDPGIRRAVLILRQAGIETFESCQGGDGHARREPVVKFSGGAWAGYRAFATTVLMLTSATREIDRMDDPSHSIERSWTRLPTGSLFMPADMNLCAKRQAESSA